MHDSQMYSGFAVLSDLFLSTQNLNQQFPHLVFQKNINPDSKCLSVSTKYYLLCGHLHHCYNQVLYNSFLSIQVRAVTIFFQMITQNPTLIT